VARNKKPNPIKPESKEVPAPPIPKNSKQDKLIRAIKENEMVIVTGPAGTGKTFLSACYAGWFYKKGYVKKIILSRPTVPTGKSIGYFPGSLEEKMEPWVTPFISALTEYLGKGTTEELLRKGKIEIVPFEVLRGRSFDSSFVILDEAQNCTPLEIKAFVTRHGENSTTVINGDTTQSDLTNTSSKASNGLSLIASMVKSNKDLKKQVALIDFTIDDIVRSGLCKSWVKAFDKQEI